MASTVVSSGSLPLTASAVRNARLRAAAISLIPALLFLFAAALRLWQPDLAPFGSTQVRYIMAAEDAAPVSVWRLFADPSLSILTLAQALLGEQSPPVVHWVVMRGLFDALGVVFLFLSARPIYGAGGAAILSVLSSVSPVLWSTSRDLAGPLTAPLAALAVWAGVSLARRPTLVRGGLFGLSLGLLMRTGPLPWLPVGIGVAALSAGRASRSIGGLTALVMLLLSWPVLPAMYVVTHVGGMMSNVMSPTSGVVTSLWPFMCLALASPLLMRQQAVRWLIRTVVGGLCVLSLVIIVLQVRRYEAAEWQRSALGRWSGNRDPDTSILAGTDTLGSQPSFREVDALARGLREAAGRSAVHEVTVPDSQPFRVPDAISYAIRRAGLRQRELPPGVSVLPLERETVFLVADQSGEWAISPLTAELHRPTSSARLFTPEGAPLGLTLLSLRPRESGHWLSKTIAVPSGQFTDGSVLHGVLVDAVNGRLTLSTYWELPVQAQPSRLGERVRAVLNETGAAASIGVLPPQAARESSELTVLTMDLSPRGSTSRPATLDVSLLDAVGGTILRVDGLATVTVPIGLPRR